MARNRRDSEGSDAPPRNAPALAPGGGSVTAPMTAKLTSGRKPRATVAVLRKEASALAVYLVAPRRQALLARVDVPSVAGAVAATYAAGWTVSLYAVRPRAPVCWWTALLPAGKTLRVGPVTEWPPTWRDDVEGLARVAEAERATAAALAARDAVRALVRLATRRVASRRRVRTPRKPPA